MHKMSIRQELRHTIFDRQIMSYLPVVETKHDQTAYGSIKTPSGFTGLQAEVYRIAEPTGLNSPWLILGDDLYTGTILSYTGLGQIIDWQFHPAQVGITGAQHGQHYGISFDTDGSTSIQYSPDIIVSIVDVFEDYGLEPVPDEYNVWQGPQGTTGLQGSIGTQGVTGAVGLGATGLQGETGVSFGVGDTGPQGTQGATGSQGETGIQGITGLQGTAGLNGETGVGSQGVTGLSGSVGSTGSQGVTGLGYVGTDGATGVQGVTGLVGLSGVTGIQGVTGLKGDTGSQGTQGVTGSIGLSSTGLQGVTGSVGVQGITGYQGITGPVGEGTQGDQGVTGLQGYQGLTGLIGATGLVTQGVTGLNGTNGTQGSTGVQGVTGVNGLQGNSGVTGLVGQTGSQGATGIQGVTGIVGSTGLQGSQGVTGLIGATGVQGVTGLVGQTGSQGTTGLSGSGSTGLQGVTGLSGTQGATGVGGGAGAGSTGLNPTYIPKVAADGVLINSIAFQNSTSNDLSIGASGLGFGTIRTTGNAWHLSKAYSDFAAYGRCEVQCAYNGKLYIGTGISAGLSDVFVYDPVTDTHTLSRDFGANVSSIECMVVWRGKLWCGIEDSTAYAAVWSFDGTTWTEEHNFGSAYTSLRSIAVLNDKLYMGFGDGTDDADLYSYDGTDWVSVWDAGSGYARIQSLHTYNGRLFIGLASGTGDGDIYSYDGVNTPILEYNNGSATYSHVWSFATFRGKLYAGMGEAVGAGDLFVRGHDGTWAIAWDSSTTGTNWRRIKWMDVYNDRLFCGMGYDADQGDVFVYDGNSATLSYNMGAGYEQVENLCTFNGKLYAGMGRNTDHASVWVYAESLESQLYRDQNKTTEKFEDQQHTFNRLNTFNAGIALGENVGFSLYSSLSADGKYSGIVEDGVAGATLAFGDICYLQTADSRWELASADNAAAGHNLKLGVCVLAATGDASVTKILLLGKVRADAVFPTLTVGAPVYMSTTAGDIQVAAPSGTTDIVRKVGYGNTADELHFYPSNDFIELA
jgi:hypothetical protein